MKFGSRTASVELCLPSSIPMVLAPAQPLILLFCLVACLTLHSSPVLGEPFWVFYCNPVRVFYACCLKNYLSCQAKISVQPVMSNPWEPVPFSQLTSIVLIILSIKIFFNSVRTNDSILTHIVSLLFKWMALHLLLALLDHLILSRDPFILNQLWESGCLWDWFIHCSGTEIVGCSGLHVSTCSWCPSCYCLHALHCHKTEAKSSFSTFWLVLFLFELAFLWFHFLCKIYLPVSCGSCSITSALPDLQDPAFLVDQCFHSSLVTSFSLASFCFGGRSIQGWISFLTTIPLCEMQIVFYFWYFWFKEIPVLFLT